MSGSRASTDALPIRLLPELRAIHVEQAEVFAPARILYFACNYDVAMTAVPAGIDRVGFVDAVRILATSKAAFLELPEALWVRFLPRWVLLAGVWKVSGLLRRRRRRAVFYAMEHNDLATLIGGASGVPAWLVFIFRLVVGASVRLFVDRICFATPAAAAAYGRLFFASAVCSRTQLELPASRQDVKTVHVEELSVLFVGVLEERKGLLLLLDAWRSVEAELPTARLTIVGPGSLRRRIDEWVALSPASRECRGQIPHERVHEAMEEARVLVSPSIPWGRSREQVCLPIKEALAAGVTVVTTRQTGLADWLENHGHQVVDPGDLGAEFVTDLGRALVRALKEPVPRELVRAALPLIDAWQAADAWLHSGDDS
ncbi:GDP-mannose-dependent alpha-(1-2)-phosphatidylinositol mannosyltransferase [Frondihabitans sp. 762G35]|nr:GDP-mannose-dependent alpha-(1-2)-phosphatidylinositol mannosyltransferase [Frondihabitans sp. 762G35]